jgi:hypothetical protein
LQIAGEKRFLLVAYDQRLPQTFYSPALTQGLLGRCHMLRQGERVLHKKGIPRITTTRHQGLYTHGDFCRGHAGTQRVERGALLGKGWTHQRKGTAGTMGFHRTPGEQFRIAFGVEDDYGAIALDRLGDE